HPHRGCAPHGIGGTVKIQTHPASRAPPIAVCPRAREPAVRHQASALEHEISVPGPAHLLTFSVSDLPHGEIGGDAFRDSTQWVSGGLPALLGDAVDETDDH